MLEKTVTADLKQAMIRDCKNAIGVVGDIRLLEITAITTTLQVNAFIFFDPFAPLKSHSHRPT